MKELKFVELCNGCRRCRLGSLSNLPNFPSLSFTTPLSVVSTQGGTVPHLTKDVLHKVVSDQAILSIPSSHFIQYIDVLKAFRKGSAQFIGMATHPVSVSVHNPYQATPSGYNKVKSVSAWTHQGRVELSAQKYSELIEQIKPQWYESLCDSDVDETATGKRVEKSMRNSLTYLTECLNLKKTSEILSSIPIFAPLLGGYKCQDRKSWSEKLSLYDVDGYSLLSLHKNGESAELIDVDVLRSLMEASLACLPSNRPVQAFGAYNPLCVLELVECGCDIFDSSLAHLLSERSCAFTFNNSLEDSRTEHSNVSILNFESKENNLSNLEPNQNGENLKTPAKRSTSDDRKTSKIARSDQTYQPRKYEIYVKDEMFKESMEPILRGCTCYACQNFTKAYVHHLLSLNELLGPELLMIHNLHHWNQFFSSIQSAIRSGQMGKLRENVSC